MGSRRTTHDVAIVAMGCTPFRDHWHSSADDLLVDAVQECVGSLPSVTLDDVDAFWVGTQGSGMSGQTLARPLRLTGKPVTRVENYCATGSEALRNAVFAVASGAYDMVMATGVEKLKDSSYSGLSAVYPPADGTDVDWTAPAGFSLLVPAYQEAYGVDARDMRSALTRVAMKNHANGALNERAQFRKAVDGRDRGELPAHRRAARCHGLLRGVRRGRRRHRRAGRGRTPVHQQARLPEGDELRRRVRCRPGVRRLRLHHLPRGRRRGPRGVRAGGRHRPGDPDLAWRRCTTVSPRPRWC